MILFAGALLLTPGFFTDAFGFALLVPQIRQIAYQAIRSRVNVACFGTPGARPSPHTRQQDDVIEGEFTEILPEKGTSKAPSGWTKD